MSCLGSAVIVARYSVSQVSSNESAAQYIITQMILKLKYDLSIAVFAKK